MKHLIANARNFYHQAGEVDGELEIETIVEAIFTTMEKSYKFAGAGLAPVEDTETQRLFLTPEGCRSLAKRLNEWADEADANRQKMIDLITG